MKVATAKEHRDFFQKEGLIEFEGFLSPNQVEALTLGIQNAYFNRTGTSADKWRQLSSEQLFLNGRDLWRASDALRQLTCQPRFANIASELVGKTPLRLGYDQFLPYRYLATNSIANPSVYERYLEQTSSLEEISSIEGLLCGLIICLSNPNEQNERIEQEGKPEGKDVFPIRQGHAIFFQPTFPIDFNKLYQHVGQSYYLIVYTERLATYRSQAKDPHLHALKHAGYILNSKLTDKLNPIVYR